MTPTGQTFLRAFNNFTIPAEATLGKSSHAIMAAKWKANFDLGPIPCGAVA